MDIDFYLGRDAQGQNGLEIMLLEKKMNIKNSVLDDIRYKQLNWYGHGRRMNEERLPRKILEQCPTGRRRRRDIEVQ